MKAILGKMEEWKKMEEYFSVMKNEYKEQKRDNMKDNSCKLSGVEENLDFSCS